MAITTSAKSMPSASRIPIEPLDIFVAGDPAGQGSKRHVGNGIMVESSKKLKPWRDDIRNALTGKDGQPIAHFPGAVAMRLEFVLYRPTSTPKKKATPPAVKKPDLDKLFRAVCDAITSAGIWRDDSFVVRASVSKRLAKIDEPTGCHITIMEG